MNTPAPPPIDSFDVPPPVVPVAPPPPPPEPAAVHPVVSPREAAIRAAQLAAAQATEIRLETPRVAPPPKAAVPVQPMPPAAPKLPRPVGERPVREAAALPKRATPSMMQRLGVEQILPSRTDRIAAGIATMFLIAMGAGGAWLRFNDQRQREQAEQALKAAIEEWKKTQGAANEHIVPVDPEEEKEDA
jgi:hypothetical protein